MYGEKGYRFATAAVHRPGRRPQREEGGLHGRRGGPRPHLRHRVRGQHGVQRRPPALDDEQHQGDRLHLAHRQEGPLRPGEAPGGPRQGPRPLPRRGLQEHRHRRPQDRGQGARRPPAEPRSDQKRRMFITIPLEEGERWKFGQVSIEGNKVYPTQILLGRSSDKTGGWLRSKVVDDGDQGDRGRLPQHRLHLRPRRAGARRARGPGRRRGHPRHRGGAVQGRPHRVPGQRAHPATRCCAASCGSTRGGLVNVDGDPQQRHQGQPARLLQAQRGEPGRHRHRQPRRSRSTCSSRGRSRTAPSCSSAAAGASSTASSASSRSAPRTSSAAASRSASRSRPAALRNYYDLSYSIPWFRDRPQSLGIRAYKQNFDYSLNSTRTSYIRDSKGAVLTYGRNFRLFQSASISYNLSKYNDKTADRPDGSPARRRPDRRRAERARRRTDRQLVAPAGLRLRQPGQPLRAVQRPADLARRSSTRAASWAATTTSSGPRSSYSIFQPVTRLPGPDDLRLQRRGAG